MLIELKSIINNLFNNIEKNNFKGWDVFDGINSKLFQKTPFYKSRFFRLLWIQFFKRSPINFRKLTAVPKGYNAKELALFIQGLINLYKINKDNKYLKVIFLLRRKVKHNNDDIIHIHFSHYGWVAVLTFPKAPIIVSLMRSDTYGGVNWNCKRTNGRENIRHLDINVTAKKNIEIYNQVLSEHYNIY